MAGPVVVRRMSWWQARSLREKWLLLGAGALLVLVLAWFLLVQPLLDARGAAAARLDSALTELAQARANAAALKQHAAPAAGNPIALPLGAFLTQSATEQGFTNAQVSESAPTRATILIPQARSPALFGWFSQLEARGLIVETLTARANADQTIGVEATVRIGGGR